VSARWRTLDGSPTRIIAHRGASGPWPEHTLPAYEQGLQDRADVLEPDLVITRDAQLLVRHDRGLRRSTDIAARPEFAARRAGGDWPVDSFDRAELAPLRAVQPFAQRERRHDGRFELLDFRQLLDWAEHAARVGGAPLTLYPELKHPAQFAAAGLDPVPPFIAALGDLEARGLRVWLQCFERAPLHRVRDALGLPVHLLVEAPCDWRALIDGLDEGIAGLGVDKTLLLDARFHDSGLVDRAHARGLAVHAWTYRDDVPLAGLRGVRHELETAFALGVDAVFCDFPATAVACRAAFDAV
jgi:glycerophosphoryl diester phosphodiesterase